MSEVVFRNENAQIVENGSELIVRFPFAPEVSKILKTRCSARWDSSRKAWIVSRKHRKYVSNLLRGYFDGETKIIVAYTDRDSPRVNGAPVVGYYRDSEWVKKPFEGLILHRRSHGSRKHPVFGGVVIFRAVVADRTEIDAEKYAVFNDRPEYMDVAVAVRNSHELGYDSKSTEKLFDTVVEELKRLEKTSVSESTVVVEGFLVLSRLPSPAVLQLRFSEVFKSTPVGKKIIDTVTGYFRNRLKRLAARYYTGILSEHAVKIADGMYLVPTKRAPAFLSEVERLREEYREYEEKLRAFFYHREIPEGVRKSAKIDPEYLDVLEEYLQEKGMSLSDIEIPAIADRVTIGLIPLRIAPELFENYIEESARKLRDDRLREVAEEVKAVREQMVASVEEEVEKKIVELAEKLREAARAKVTRRRLKFLRARVKDVEKLATELGMAEKHSARLHVMKGIIDAMEKGKTEDIEEVVKPTSGRVKALLEAPI